MKAVSGYLANDGTFFDYEESCNLYEARKALKTAFENSLFFEEDLLTVSFFDMLNSLEPKIIAFYAAKAAEDMRMECAQKSEETIEVET